MHFDPLKLASGLPEEMLVQAICACVHGGDMYKLALGFYLLEYEKRSHGFSGGYRDVFHFLSAVVHSSVREGREAMRVARALADLPKLEAAFLEKRVLWSQLREIVRKARPETEEAWITFAEQHSCEEVERAVSAAKDGEPPKESGLGTARVYQNIHMRVPHEVYELFQTAVRKEMDDAGLDMSITPEAARVIAMRSRGTPREALRMLKWARDVAQDAGKTEVGSAEAKNAARRMGIDANGLGEEDRKILAVLVGKGRPLGIEPLAASVGMDAETLKRVYEPYLLKMDFVIRTPSGRQATTKAQLFYGGANDPFAAFGAASGRERSCQQITKNSRKVRWISAALG